MVSTSILFSIPLLATLGAAFSKEDVLLKLNSYRAEHSVPDLTWSSSLEAAAQSYAETCDFTPYPSSGAFGQIIMHGASWPATEMVDYMYECGFLYDYNQPGPSDSTDSFTQVVWKSTTEVGCGWASCKETDSTPLDELVCFFKKAGNVPGEFAANVLPPKNAKKQKREVVVDENKMIVASRRSVSRIVG